MCMWRVCVCVFVCVRGLRMCARVCACVRVRMLSVAVRSRSVACMALFGLDTYQHVGCLALMPKDSVR